MNHLLMFYDSAAAAGATDLNLPAVIDQKITVSASGNFILPQDCKALGAYAIGASLIRVKLVTPYLRQISPSYIQPFEVAAAVPTLPNLSIWGSAGPQLKAGDETQIQASNNLSTSTEAEACGLWIDLDGPPPHGGPYITIRLTGSGSFSLTAGAWQLIQLGFDTILPYGRYHVAGMSVNCDATGFARLVMPKVNYRPGVVIQGAVGLNDWWHFRAGRFGSFGEFDCINAPMLEIFPLSTITAAEVYLDVVKIG